MIYRFRWPLLLLIIIAGAWYIFTPHASKEDQAYYVSVFCTLDATQQHDALNAMRQVIEGGNSDYALHKIHFQPALAKQTINAWQTLNDQQRAAARDDVSRCRSTLIAALH